MSMKLNEKLAPNFNKTITIFNKYSDENFIDYYKKTVLKNCSWTSQNSKSINGTEIIYNRSFIIRIPKNLNYRPHNLWIENLNGFTFNLGDFVFLGEIKEDITALNINEIFRKYRANAFEISFFKDNTDIDFLSHYKLEGV